MKTIAAFIDGSNLYATSKGLGFDLDYRRILTYLEQQGHLVRAFYYTAISDSEEHNPIRPLVDWLAYNGYTMITKPTKEFIDHEGKRKIKGNMDVDMAVDMMELAGHVDHVFLFSGDGDFRRLVEAVQRKGVRVTVISSVKTSPNMCADELRRQADRFIDLETLRDQVMRIHENDNIGNRKAAQQ